MKELSVFLDKIGSEYKLGDPWKHTKTSIVAIVPILKYNPTDRDYITYPEVKDSVNVIDTGSINKLNIQGINQPVFIKGGTIFQGVGTQSRSIEHSIILEPNIKMDIEVDCVHASHAIHHGSNFKYKGIAPRIVRASLHDPARGQGDVWKNVSFHSCTLRHMSGDIGPMTSGGNVYGAFQNDDLINMRDASKKIESKFNDILKSVPVFENQIGAIILGSNGVEGIETFDHPDSWKAQYKDVIESYEDVFAEEQELFSMNMDKINDYIERFISNIRDATVSNIGNNCSLIKMSGYIGEFVVHNGCGIHLFVMKNDDNKKDDSDTFVGHVMREGNPSAIQGPPSGRYGPTLRTRLSQYDRPDVRDLPCLKRRGMDDVVGSLSFGPKTYSEIQRKSKVSSATLSKRLREAQDEGIIEKGFRRNGTKSKTVYKIKSD